MYPSLLALYYVDISVVPPKKFIVNLEQPCASMCTNFPGTLLAVVGRKGTFVLYVVL